MDPRDFVGVSVALHGAMSSRRNRLFLAKETLRHLPAQALARVAGGETTDCVDTNNTSACETFTCGSVFPCADPILGRKSQAAGCTTR